MIKNAILSIAALILVACSSPANLAHSNREIVHGFAAPGFELVRDEFKRNLTKRNEIGAACAVYYKNQKVVDIWGGIRDKKRHVPWEEHTLVSGWSSSKGPGAMCLAKLHAQGYLDYDKQIAAYWPEFAKRGKENIIIRQLLSQQAGLCLLNPEDAGKYSFEQLKNHDTLSKVLENILPIWKPGEQYGYHGGSEGLYEAELVRRIDPAHRSIGRFFQEEIAKPLNVEYYIGLPESLDQSRIAHMYMANPLVAISHLGDMPPGVRKAVFNSKSVFMRSMTEIKGIDLNNRKYLAFEDPDGNGTGEARALAALYNDLINGGTATGIRQETIDLLEGAPIYPHGNKIDCVMGIPMPTVLGFIKPETGGAQFAKSQRGFGFIGANGAMGCADPDRQLSFAYLTNYNAFRMSKNGDLVLKAVWQCIDKIDSANK
jgi:CubicO group peptidase (beta-lactamase class C family)